MKAEVLGYGIPENNNTSGTAPAQNFVDTTEDDENRNVSWLLPWSVCMFFYSEMFFIV